MPQNFVYWYSTKSPVTMLHGQYTTEVAIVGGGMAGLTAAQAFKERGYSVILIERSFCGAGASGKSSGFITPDSEIDLTILTRHHGAVHAQKIWDFVTRGVEHIRHNILTFGIECDYTLQDSVAVANSASRFDEVKEEHENRLLLGFQSQLYKKSEMTQVLGSPHYFGARKYAGTFGIKAFNYCQRMKDILQESGVKIFEESPAVSIEENIITTPHGTIKADQIIVCADFMSGKLGYFRDKVMPMLTCLLLSEPLSDKVIFELFRGNSLLVWDTDIIYSYFRLVEGNRLLLGGGSLLTTYLGKEWLYYPFIYHKLTHYFKKKFPDVSIKFDYQWPGLIGASKDIMPLAGKMSDSIYCISAATGLPWAASLGIYAAEELLDKRTDLHPYFNPHRTFPINSLAQKFMTKPVAFALSHLMTEFL